MRIYHLSDIHYGRRDLAKYPTESAHYWAENKRTPKPAVLANLLIAEARDRKPDVIVVSGDIGWSGAKDDYGYALDFFRRLRSQVKAPIVVCPGNHDVDFSDSL